MNCRVKSLDNTSTLEPDSVVLVVTDSHMTLKFKQRHIQIIIGSTVVAVVIYLKHSNFCAYRQVVTRVS